MTEATGRFDLVLDLIREEVESGRLPTAVFGVATSAGIQVLEAFGSNGRRPLAVDDTFLLFSASKPLVALAALRLVEQGRLALRTARSEALPQFGVARIGDEVTLWHLLTHTAGIVEATVTPDTSVREQLLTAPQMFRAGEYALYCNVAFEGLAALVESVTGGSFHDHLVADLNAITGVGGLTYDPTVPVVPIAGLDRVVFDVQRFRDLKHPAGALNAKAEDLLALGQLLNCRGRRLQACVVSEDGKLQAALARVSGRNPMASSCSLTLLDRKGAPVRVEVMKLPGSIVGPASLAVVVQGSRPSESTLALLDFGLTNAEAEVALALRQGLSPAEIAKSRNTSIETVRQQLRTTYAKLGVNRQAQLVMFVRALE
jgi:CubicO group peptidase (beta-lactamase class C family)/DNA-binding CsgD family transcriptional regulator